MAAPKKEKTKVANFVWFLVSLQSLSCPRLVTPNRCPPFSSDRFRSILSFEWPLTTYHLRPLPHSQSLIQSYQRRRRPLGRCRGSPLHSRVGCSQPTLNQWLLSRVTPHCPPLSQPPSGKRPIQLMQPNRVTPHHLPCNRCSCTLLATRASRRSPLGF